MTAALAVVVALVSAATAPPQVPAGFHATVYASGLRAPTALVLGPTGHIYATEQEGRVVSFSRGARQPRVFASGFADSTLGLTWHEGRLYVADLGRVSVLTDPDRDRRANGRRAILRGLPHGLHQQDAIVAGPGGRLYLGNGSTCDACRERDRRAAAILSFRPDGSDLRVVASGLRNPYGLAFAPDRSLWVTDEGRDAKALNAPDELNRIVAGRPYGWPSCYGRSGGSGCAGTEPPVVELEPHGAATGLAFAPKAFDPGMQGDVFVAMWGTYFGNAHGRYVARVDLGGSRPRVTRFARGLDHPIAVLFAPDGALLVADHGTGIVWRIART